MHVYPHYFPVRDAADNLDVVPLLQSGFAAHAERVQKTLIEFNGVPTSYGEMAQRVARMRTWLAHQGIGHGDRVALMLENGLEHMALIYALMLSGAVWVPVNTRLKAPGIDYLLGHCKPDLFITQPSFAQALAGLEQEPKKLVWLNELELPVAEALPHIPIASDDTLCLIYTSGTTGAPKGVVFTHRMMRIASEGTVLVSGVKPGDRMFVWEPLCHIGGAQLLLVPFLADVSLQVVERFSASRFWQQVDQARSTHLHYLGGILDIVCQLPPESQPAQHTLQVAWGAGVSTKSWDSIVQRLGIALRECYGMTEVSSFTTVNYSGKPGSIGRALPWLRVELLDENDQPVPTGELGQIVVSTDVEGCFLPTYLDNPKATSEARRHGKLYTGDMARSDDEGDLFFVGRKTDSMRVRGENVSAWEIERIFVMHPAIAAVAAIGVASDVGEQEIMLFVQFKEGMRLPFDELAAWASARLASYQLPRYYQQTQGFETTLSERIRKHLLSRDLSLAWDRASSVLK